MVGLSVQMRRAKTPEASYAPGRRIRIVLVTRMTMNRPGFERAPF
jgi:hypothetical protein